MATVFGRHMFEIKLIRSGICTFRSMHSHVVATFTKKMKITTLLLILLTSTYCFGQSGEYCGKRKKLAISRIKTKFPYNDAETIKLVSFKHDYSVHEPDTVEVPIYKPEIPRTNGKIDLTRMFEVKTLDSRLTEKILDILVNYDNEHRSMVVTFCYEPRNGILFLDKGNNVLGYVEICFECHQYKVEPSTMAVTLFCIEKFDALRSIFKEAGVTYGTVRNQDD
jgi:hypothetical protein